MTDRPSAFIICADAMPDLIAYSTQERDAHRNDLRAMGCRVQVVEVPASDADLAFDILDDSARRDTRVTSIRKAALRDVAALIACTEEA